MRISVHRRRHRHDPGRWRPGNQRFALDPVLPAGSQPPPRLVKGKPDLPLRKNGGSRTGRPAGHRRAPDRPLLSGARGLSMEHQGPCCALRTRRTRDAWKKSGRCFTASAIWFSHASTLSRFWAALLHSTPEETVGKDIGFLFPQEARARWMRDIDTVARIGRRQRWGGGMTSALPAVC